MTSTIGTAGREVQLDEAVRNGMKRSWLSLHFNTRRVWHLILVQLGGVLAQTVDEQETASAHLVRLRGAQATLERLVEDYRAALFARRWA